MTPAIQRASSPLLSSLHVLVRRDVLRRVEAMERELSFLDERRNEDLILIRKRGWSDEQLQLIFVLNSVYQKVLGPLQAAAKEGPEGLGSSVPVLHGTSKFSRKTSGAVTLAMTAFRAMVTELRIQPSWLHANTCGDVVYSIAVFERDGAR